MPVNEAEIEKRIDERMHKLWQQNERQGSPESFREQARLIVAIEDTQETTLLPIEPPGPEPIVAVENLGEFPTMTDQGEGEAFPSREFIPEKG